MSGVAVKNSTSKKALAVARRDPSVDSINLLERVELGMEFSPTNNSYNGDYYKDGNLHMSPVVTPVKRSVSPSVGSLENGGFFLYTT